MGRRVGIRTVKQPKLSQSQGIARLKRLGIKTTSDLDNWIKNHPRTDKLTGRQVLMSRFGALKQLIGENAATFILNELAIQATVPLRGK